MRVSPRALNAESPSKNCVSGIVPAADSRLNHPLDAMLLLRCCYLLDVKDAIMYGSFRVGEERIRKA